MLPTATVGSRQGKLILQQQVICQLGCRSKLTNRVSLQIALLGVVPEQSRAAIVATAVIHHNQICIRERLIKACGSKEGLLQSHTVGAPEYAGKVIDERPALSSGLGFSRSPVHAPLPQLGTAPLWIRHTANRRILVELVQLQTVAQQAIGCAAAVREANEVLPLSIGGSWRIQVDTALQKLPAQGFATQNRRVQRLAGSAGV